MPDPVPNRPPLESLAPRYDPEQHETYLRYLQAAVKDPRNLNIALTGRYGTGKSSVLDEFVSQNENKTLRVAISSLGTTTEDPNSEGSTRTNRIQKELVKQLIYRASPREFRFSRFNRIIPLSRTRAALEAAAAVLVIGGILWFFKVLPDIKLLPDAAGFGRPWLVRLESWFVLAALAVVPLAALRLLVYGRFVVSDVSAAGATVKMAPRGSTYFDEYLEELVYFFDRVFPEVVIFEDLDRFDDPHIFEALRELNTLLNQTPKRLKEKKPLRFVYAIKDSLFERLGTDSQSGHDAAAAETVRANRTKFFDVVIPVVPFLSHRNAQDFLAALLKEREVTVERALTALIAQHTTDMRLLRNICNEYMVFSERLLKSKRTAPGLTPGNLLALVAYKNFHMEDFERILRRDSDLDVLYDRRRELVRACIDKCEERKRDVLNEPVRHRSMAKLAEQLGARLVALGRVFKRVQGQQNWKHLLFNVDDQQFGESEVSTYRLWATLVEAREIIFLAAFDQAGSGGRNHVGQLTRVEFEAFFPEALNLHEWPELDRQANQEVLDQLDNDIAFLRRADFKDLAGDSRFTLIVEGGDKNFVDIVDTTMKSQLARDLVKQGHLDRNFALYAAQFYGDFTGVDVANFIVHTVETTSMEIDYTFSRSDDIANLLVEVPEDFFRTVSAYNTAILDHLLKQGDLRAADIADTIVSNFGDQAREFLRSYLNSDSERTAFAAMLSKHPWREAFVYLVEDDRIPADVRPGLVSAALRAADGAHSYELTSEVRDFIVGHYSKMEVFTESQGDEIAAKVVAFISEMGVVLPELAGLDETIRAYLVRHDLYRLTGDNLRVALGITGDVSLDRVRKNKDVFDLCRRSPDDYLAAVREDSGHTPHTVLTEEVLDEVLIELPPSWDAGHLQKLIARAAPGSRLEHLEHVPEPCWRDLAAHHLFHATVRNVRVYCDALGSVDQMLADLLLRAGRIDGTGEEEPEKLLVASRVLNAADTIPDARRRINLVESLGLEGQVPPEQIEPEAGDLLALLLEHKLVEDSHESFDRFRGAGWSAIEPAIMKSAAFVAFMTPELVDNVIPELLRSTAVSKQVKDKVLDALAQYLPQDDKAALEAVARYSLAMRRSLPLDQVARIAKATRDADLTLPLLVITAPATPVADVLPVLADLGEPYSHLTTKAKAEFEVPGDDAHRNIFERLKKENLVSEFRKRPLRDVYLVKLA